MILIHFYHTLNYNILIGSVVGLFALIGDLIESFFKRQLNIKPGNKFIPFDQIDWVIGSSIILIFFEYISLKESLIAILLFFILHIVTKHIGFYLNLDNKKW